MLALWTTSAALAGFYVSTDRTSYSGGVAQYATLADAQAGVNALAGPTAFAPRNTTEPLNTPARDLAIWVASDAPDAVSPGYANANVLMTAWYYTITGPGAGWGNPNNTNGGFFQIYDLTAATLTSQTGTWSADRKAFTRQIAGANAAAAEYGRSWVPGAENQAAGATAADFASYALSVTFGFDEAAQYDATAGGWYLQAEPTSVSGTLSGVFTNTSTTHPALNGFYAFAYTLGLDSWVYANQNSLVGDYDTMTPSEFFSTTVVVPEPGAVLLGLIGLAAAGVAGRRRG